MPDRGLTHLDPLGRARMVDVTPKEPTHRRAVARGRVHMKSETTSLVARGAINKGDVLAVARVAGIQAAKRTPELIPLCHPLSISGVTVDGYDPDGREVAVEAGIVFLDAKGSVVRSRVTNVVTSEGDNAYTRTGGWRGAQPGIGGFGCVLCASWKCVLANDQ